MRILFVVLFFLIIPSKAFSDTQISRIRIYGNKAIDKTTAQRISGARRYDFYKEGFCQTAEKRLVRWYSSLGYTKATVRCELREDELLIEIAEGKQDTVLSVAIVQSGNEAKIVNQILSPITEQLVGRAIFPSALRDWKRALLFGLRKEGYLFASLQLSVLAEGRVNISVNPRTRVKFLISGNSIITYEDILSLLQISDRLSPISNRAIDELPEQIQELYAGKGFPFTDVEVVEQEPDEGVVVYLVLISEGERKFITSVNLSSDSLPANVELASILKTKVRGFGPLSLIEPGILSNQKISNDLINLEDTLRSAGYIDAKADYHLIVSQQGIEVYFEIIPGKQYLVDQITHQVDCPAEIDAPSIVINHLSDTHGLAATTENLSPRKVELQKELVKLGFPSPVIELIFDKTDSSLKAILSCGDREEVAGIELEGIVHTDRTYIESLLRVSPGDSVASLDSGIERVRSTGVFSSVDVRLEESKLAPTKPGYKPRDVRIIFRERDTGVLDTSVSINTEDGLRLGGELSQRNFRAKGETLSLNADLFVNGGQNLFSAGRARAFWRVPNLFGSEKLEYLTEGYLQYDIQNVNQFSFTRKGMDSQARYRIEKFILSSGISIFQDDVYDVPEDIIVSERDTSKTFYSFLTAKLEFDDRDSVLAPSRGFYSALVGKISSNVFGSDVNLGQITAEAKYYSPLSSDLVWVNGVRGTVVEPFSDTDTVPLSQRLFLGGANSLRGFDRNRLSPLGVEGSRAGGDEAYVLNTELQWNLTDSLQLASFIDAGEVKLTNGGQNLQSRGSDFRVSPGVGIRYRTPVGPLGVDIGIPLNKRDGESAPRVYFGFNGIF